MTKPLVIISVVISILLLIISIIYFVKPANNLPTLFPGYDPNLTRHHLKHGIGALLLSIASFSFSWFQSGNKLQKEIK